MIKADAVTFGQLQAADLTGEGEELHHRVFGIEPHLDRMAAAGDVFLRLTQFPTAGDMDHFLHQIRARQHFRYRMFHLNAGVHLDKEEFFGCAVVKILQCPRTNVADGLGQ